ncbi:calcium/calmodulin-dependent protein kinase kinase 2 [Holotrichia oblita]|uniref:Calcium/calmodulin-dependent protein kinase kinase 2 n=1 Tax=Holotrichia oblita TaxID=644536 RepID=A0ACB9SID0_HOLOL|nr:calcium/calmodulin-dependent protein kinase kinase 2 [Holotrichia oblita]
MQMIAHVTDLLKYEPTIPITTTPTTVATQPHNPGIFAPTTPPSGAPQKRPYRVTTTTRRPWWKLGETQNEGYFSRYKNGWSYTISSPIEDHKARNLNQEEPQIQDTNDLDLLGSLPIDLYKRINSIPDFDDESDPFGQVQKFTDDYDDKAPPFLRKKRPPPTRAYVTLLSLYDNLNKEAKKLMLNKYSGYSRRTLEDLETFAQSTSAHQLEKILAKIVERRDINDAQTIKKISTMVEDLQQDNSYINQALADIPPLHYDIHF